MTNGTTRRTEQLKDRRDLRRALIERRNASRSDIRRADIDARIAQIEEQIKVLAGGKK